MRNVLLLTSMAAMPPWAAPAHELRRDQRWLGRVWFTATASPISSARPSDGGRARAVGARRQGRRLLEVADGGRCRDETARAHRLPHRTAGSEGLLSHEDSVEAAGHQEHAAQALALVRDRSPDWKPSYRIKLGENGKVDLEGWAIVDNTSGEDWKNVKLGVARAPRCRSLRSELGAQRARETLPASDQFAIAPPTGMSVYGNAPGVIDFLDDATLTLAEVGRAEPAAAPSVAARPN